MAGGPGPGIYNDITVHGGANITLSPGLYCINGSFTASSAGKVSGNGVLLAFFGGNFDLGGANHISLSAPLSPFLLKSVKGTSYDYAGLLIYADPGSYTGKSKTFQINGTVTATSGSSTSIFGTIYIPTASCQINGNVTFTTINTQMICDTVTFGGGGSGVIDMSLNDTNPFDFGGNIKLMQ